MQTKWRVLVAIAFGTYVATMDFSIVNIALPTLSREFDASPDTVIWATLVFSLTATSLTLTAGRVGDLFGISMVLIDGQIRIGRSRNTPPAARAAEVVKGHGPGGGGH